MAENQDRLAITVYPPYCGHYSHFRYLYHWVARYDGAVIGEGHAGNADSAYDDAMALVVDTIPAPEM